MGHKHSKQKRSVKSSKSSKLNANNLKLKLEEQFPSDPREDYDIFEELKKKKLSWILTPYDQFEFDNLPYHLNTDTKNHVVVCDSKKLKTA